MPGRIPKPKSQRARTNKTMGATLPKEGSGIEAPEFPGEEELCAYARDYWQRIWSSPMALVYLDADIPALIRLTELINIWSLLKENNVLSEIRQLEDRFGLSPLSRRKLEWEITMANANPEEVIQGSTTEDARWLKAVN